MLYLKHSRSFEFDIMEFRGRAQLNFIEIYIKVKKVPIVAERPDRELAHVAPVLLF